MKLTTTTFVSVDGVMQGISRRDEDPMGFARMLKLTVLNAHCKTLRNRAAQIIREAHEEAQNRIETMNIYDCEHIVFQSSRQEGVWEPDTLFRLFGLFHRAKARELSRSEDELRQVATFIRTVSGVSTDSEGPPTHDSWKIRRLELYEEGDYLNLAHMPIEVGDIFRKDEGGIEFVLLTQPCDIMVREDGSRHPDVNEAIVAKIVSNLPQDAEGHPTGHEAHYELPYYDSVTKKPRYVSFRAAHTVKLWVVDLCVYQDDGAAVYKVGDRYPANTVPAWKNRFSKISSATDKIIDDYRSLQSKLVSQGVVKATRNIALKGLIPQSSNENIFKGKINISDKSIGFGIKRVRRLCQPYAAALLTKYSNYQARAAFDHDFGRER